MASGFFLGGLASGFQRESAITNQANYQQGLLKLEQRRLQQQQEREQNANYMQLRSEAVKHLDDTMTQLKIAHPDWGPMQLASNPAIVALKDHIGQFDQNLKMPNTIDSIVASLAERPSAAVTEKTMAAAKEPPGQAELRAAQAEYYRGQAKLFGGDENPGAGPAKPSAQTDVGVTQPDTVANPANGEGTQFIKSPFTPRQKAIVFQSGSTPEQFDFDAVMYAYGNTNVTTGYRSYKGVNPVTVMRSRAAQYWMDKFPGEMGPQQANGVMTEFRAMQHGANTAASIDARMTEALTKAENTAQIVMPLVDKVDRTKFKDWNDFMVNVNKRTGNQDEVRLGIALETLASNYGVSLGMGNTQLTDFQTQRAEKMLQQGWDKGQLGAAVDQIKKEMLREEAGTRQGIGRYIGGMQDTMSGKSSSPSSPQQGGITVHGFTFTPSGQ